MNPSKKHRQIAVKGVDLCCIEPEEIGFDEPVSVVREIAEVTADDLGPALDEQVEAFLQILQRPGLFVTDSPVGKQEDAHRNDQHNGQDNADLDALSGSSDRLGDL